MSLVERDHLGGRTRQRANVGPLMAHAPLWLADWSDSEDADFRAACAAAGVEARVLRAPALGRSVGTHWHRLRSWPSYLALAVAGLARAGPAPVVAWQPLAGSLAGLLRPGGRPRLVVLNPLLEPDAEGARSRLVLAGLRRAERIVLFSRQGVLTAERMGLDPSRLTFMPLGVRARRSEPLPPGNYLLAAGRDHRDWQTLVEAAEGLEAEIRVLGPHRLSAPPTVRVLPSVDRAGFLDLLEASRALVVPLVPAVRPAGQLAVLDAMSVGRAVVATRGAGTEDYVSERTGRLVPPRDPAALRQAMREVLARGTAEQMGANALRDAKGPLSLERFVRNIDDQARAVGEGALRREPERPGG